MQAICFDVEIDLAIRLQCTGSKGSVLEIKSHNDAFW